MAKWFLERESSPAFSTYDAARIPSVDCAAMLEYGTGVFFKSAGHTWTFEGGTSSHIDLSPERTEALRKFVHREAPFPADMVLTVCLSSKGKQFLGVIPPVGMVIGGTEDEKYYFYVSGVYYCLLIGSHRYQHESARVQPAGREARIRWGRMGRPGTRHYEASRAWHCAVSEAQRGTEAEAVTAVHW